MSLIKSNGFSASILTMWNTTIREIIPSDLELTKSIPKFLHDFGNYMPRSGKLEIIIMFCHHANKFAVAEKGDVIQDQCNLG